MGQMFKAKVQY